MDALQVVFLTAGLPIIVLGLHEITHLAAARTISPVSVDSISYVPFRLRVDFHYTVRQLKCRLVALAPLFVGIILAVVATQSALWRRLQDTGPYYLHYLVGINWLLCTSPSPADLRSALVTPEMPANGGEN